MSNWNTPSSQHTSEGGLRAISITYISLVVLSSYFKLEFVQGTYAFERKERHVHHLPTEMLFV